jgi:hypothetical protein
LSLLGLLLSPEFPPDVASWPHRVAVLAGRQSGASRAEVLGEGPRGGEKALGVPRCHEPLPPPLPLTCRVVAILHTSGERAMLPVFHAR